MAIRWLVRAFSCVAVVAILASCGGGGGGDGGNGGSGNGGDSTAVTVQRPSPAAIDREVLIDEPMPDIELTGTAVGDLNSLNGKTLYVTIEDPASLFESNAQLVLWSTDTGGNYRLTLRGKALRTPGKFTGNLTIHACLDAQCAVRLNGTPMAVPFNVTVLPGLVLSTTRVDVSVPFGTAPAERRVEVTLPKNSAGWVASVTTPYNPYVPGTLSVEPANREVTDDHLQLKLAVAPPGTYVETVRVHASVRLADGRVRDFDPVIEVHYTVTENALLDHVFSPSRLDMVRSHKDPLIREVSYSLTTNTGVSARLVGVEYLSGSAVSGPFNSWWSEYPYRANHVCTGTIADGGVTIYDCLAPGLYTAQVRYRLDGPGGTREVLYPITLTVAP